MKLFCRVSGREIRPNDRRSIKNHVQVVIQEISFPHILVKYQRGGKPFYLKAIDLNTEWKT